MSPANKDGHGDVILAAVGDIHVERVPPQGLMRHVAPVLRDADVTFANAEQMYSDQGAPNAHHATFSHPRNIEALVDAGIDVLSLANNHTMDWGPDGLLDTLRRLADVGISPVGVGSNIAQARRAVVLERKGIRIGFLAYSSTGPDGYQATRTSPGYAPVRAWTRYQKIDYQPATPPRILSGAYKRDLHSMCNDVAAMAQTVDICVVSFHWGLHFVPRAIPDYCFEVGHAAVDAGAHLILGTHPHMLKGIELYNDTPIFYSTGNFAFEQGAGPEQYRGTFKTKQMLHKLYNIQLDPDYPTYPFPADSLATIIVKCHISKRRIRRVSFFPCYINKNAEPEIFAKGQAHGEKVSRYIQDITETEVSRLALEWNNTGTEVIVS